MSVSNIIQMKEYFQLASELTDVDLRTSTRVGEHQCYGHEFKTENVKLVSKYGPDNVFLYMRATKVIARRYPLIGDMLLDFLS